LMERGMRRLYTIRVVVSTLKYKIH
jgi:hypothetical protein